MGVLDVLGDMVYIFELNNTHNEFLFTDYFESCRFNKVGML